MCRKKQASRGTEEKRHKKLPKNEVCFLLTYTHHCKSPAFNSRGVKTLEGIAEWVTACKDSLVSRNVKWPIHNRPLHTTDLVRKGKWGVGNAYAHHHSQLESMMRNNLYETLALGDSHLIHYFQR